jgi:protein disulfide-isomerase A6
MQDRTLSCLNAGGGFYSSDSGVVNLNGSTFAKRVLESDDLWFVEYYAPWCGHCKQLKPEYIDAAKCVQPRSMHNIEM